jgi:predicted ATPase
MGINTGAAWAGSDTARSGGYTGYSTLARAQRVMSTAYGGQILLSNTSADLLLGELPAGLGLRDMDKHRLKGLLNPEHLWQVLAPGLPQDFPALQTLNSIPNNLPLQLTAFIGREKEIAEIKSLVEQHRLVTLTGSGGVGKTRHLLQVAAELLDVFPDGVWLVELERVSNPELVPHALASALGLHEQHQGQALVEALAEHLRAKQVLLLLDNCEHLLEACAQLAEALLHACPPLKILLSSREALGMAGETSFRVSSLSLPDPQNLPSLERLTQYDSVRLFIERAAAVKSDFAVSSGNAPAMAQVCARLDGIPLAIELAAARVRGLSVEQISQRLDDRFRLLTAGSRTALPRHQTLRAMIDWSYELLSPPERLLFCRLAVFVGDWSLEAAEAVCAGAGPGSESIEGADVMDLLLRLVDKSLVVSEERGGQARYRMLETLHQFAGEKLAASGEQEALRSRHLEFFLRFSESAADRLGEADQLIWLEQVEAEYRDLGAALEWAADRTAGAQPAFRLAQATAQLADVQNLLGMGTRAIPLYQRALELAQQAGEAERTFAVRLHGKIVETVANLRLRIDRVHFRALMPLAAASSQAIVEALQAAQDQPPSREKVRLLITLSSYAQMVLEPMDWAMAETYGRQAVEMAEGLDARVELSAALGSLADLYFLRALGRQRMQVVMRRLELSRAVGFSDMPERTMALIDTGQALRMVGEFAQGLPYLREAEKLALQLRTVDLEKWALDEQTYCLMGLDRWDEILDLSEKLRDMQQRYASEQIGLSCTAIAVMASVHSLRGELELGRSQRQQAQDIMTDFAGPPEGWLRGLRY